MEVTESVPEFVFGKSVGLTINDKGRVYDGFRGEVFKTVMELVLSKASGLFYKWQRKSLRRSQASGLYCKWQ